MCTLPERTLTLDIGNSSVKCALWKESRIVSRPTLKELEKQGHKSFVCGVSQVGKLSSEDEKSLKEVLSLTALTFHVGDYFQQKSFLEMPVHYALTLGQDRLIAAYEIFCESHSSHHSQSRSLIIDAGSFITWDFVSKKGFEGGHIFPSQKKWQEAYASGALLKEHLNCENLSLGGEGLSGLPQRSDEAMMLSYPLALVGLFEQLICQYHPSRVFLTGGGASKLYDLLTSQSQQRLPMEIRKDLIHEGLYRVIQELQREA